MTAKTALKVLLFNLLLSLAIVCVFSPAFFHVSFAGASALEAAVGVTALALGAALFFYVNYRLIFKAPDEPQTPVFDKDPATLDDCAAAVRRYLAEGAKAFRRELDASLAQIGRMKKREASLEELLTEKFSPSEMSYGKFRGAFDGVERVMILNIKSALRRIIAFDEDEYAGALSKDENRDGGSAIMRSKRALFDEYAAFMQKSVDNNEEILLRVDKLILEISKLSGIAGDAVEDMDAMKEIDELIHDAKWYK